LYILLIYNKYKQIILIIKKKGIKINLPPFQNTHTNKKSIKLT
jgi:hypothetical protein